MRRWTAVLVLSLLLTGCSEERSELTQVPAWQSGARTTPAPLSVDDAQIRYIKIVRPYNAALEKLEDAANAGQPWRTVRTLAGEVATTNAAHAALLRQHVWPETARAPMAALLAENDIALRHWRRAGEAANAEELMREIRSASTHSGAKEAGRVRAALGLPAYRES